MRESGIRTRQASVFELVTWGGTRPPVVAIHGFLGQTTMWSETLSGVSDLGTLALGRLPGHGSAPWSPRGATFADVVRDMIEALPRIAPAWLAGYSMGARVALAMLLERPERFLGALLIGVHPGLRDEAERGARAAWDDEQADAIERAGLDAFAASWEKLPLFASQSRLSPDLRARQAWARRAHTAEGVAAAMRVCGLGRMPPLWDALARCERPLVLVTGALDEKFGAIAEESVKVAPRAEHTRVAAVGHNVALEDPATVRGLMRFCLTTGRGSPRPL